MATLQFDATKVAPTSDRTAVPEGEYNVILASSEIAKSQNGQMIKCTFKILDGPCVGQTISNNINFQNSNETAQRIGQAELSALCHAVGVLQISDTAQLHGRPLRLKVSVREVVKEKDGVKTTNHYNDVDAILKADGSPVVAGQTAAPAASAPPAFVTQAAPAPAPAPVPAPAPAPAPVPDGKLYHVAHKGTDLTKGTPVNAAAVSAFGHPLAELHVCENAPGAQWVSGSTLQPAPVTTAPWVK